MSPFAVAKSATQVYKLPDPAERMFQREKLLLTSESSDLATAYLKNIIRNITSLEAAVDWTNSDVRFKRAFRTRMAPLVDPESFAEANALAEGTKQKQITALVRRFEVKHNKLMNRRKQLLELYKEVCFLPQVG